MTAPRMTGVEFDWLADIEHDDTALAEHIGEVLEGRDAVTSQLRPVSRRASVAGGATALWRQPRDRYRLEMDSAASG